MPTRRLPPCLGAALADGEVVVGLATATGRGQRRDAHERATRPPHPEQVAPRQARIAEDLASMLKSWSSVLTTFPLVKRHCVLAC